MSTKIFTVLYSFLFLVSNLNAQYCVPFITLDSDGYTNLREKPNSKSKIVDKVYKYEVFCFIGIECDDNLANYDDSNWIPVSTDQKGGYIYRKNILRLDKLHSLKVKQKINNNSVTQGILINANDTLSVVMHMKPFDKDKHELKITNDYDGEHVWYIDGKDFYGTGHRMPVREIKTIEILCKGIKTVLPNEKTKKFYNPHTMCVRIGQSGELYLNICGGGDENQYSVWVSIVDGNIVYECFEDYCW
jgi:hypothetical protein